MGLNLKALIGKLNDQARAAMQGAAGLCLSRTHYHIEIEHYLSTLLDSSSNDIACIVKHFEIDKSRLTAELARSLDKLKSGNAHKPDFDDTVVEMLNVAWTIGSLDFNAGSVRTGFTILALAGDEKLSRLMRELSPREFPKINADALKKDLLAICALSQETTTSGSAIGAGAG